MTDEEYFFVYQEEEDSDFKENEISENEELEIDESEIKSLQTQKNNKGEIIYFQYSWRKGNMAYYKCLSRSCNGRAKGSLKVNTTKNSWTLEKFEVNAHIKIIFPL